MKKLLFPLILMAIILTGCGPSNAEPMPTLFVIPTLTSSPAPGQAPPGGEPAEPGNAAQPAATTAPGGDTSSSSDDAPSTPGPTVTIAPNVPTDDPSGVCICSRDNYSCELADFATVEEAQACYDYCVGIGVGDVHDLDPDGDGVACNEGLF